MQNNTVHIIEGYDIASCASGKAGGFLAREWANNSPLEELQHFS